MDEMRLLGEFRAAVSPPDARTLTAARARMLDAGIRGTVGRPRWFRRRRAGWVAGGLSLAATAAVAAVMVAPTVTGSGGPQHAMPVSHLSGRQILLDAATAAAAAPATAGTYWYVKTAGSAPQPYTQQAWYTHAGVEYSATPDGKEVYQPGADCDFSVGGRWLSYQQLKQLPTDPGALKAWITWSMTSGWQPLSPCAAQDPHPAPVPARSSLNIDPSDVASALSNLLFQVPAPPALRAAAFRALASMQDVRELGYADGGVALAIYGPSLPASKFRPGKEPRDTGVVKLIIDPANSMLRAETNYEGTTQILATGWTNHMPKIVPLSQVFPAKS
jgi:hypothetical protein